MSRKKIGLIVLIALVLSIFLCSCQQDPSCSLEPESGTCRANFPKYYFDNTTKKCEVFTWGGCDGVVPFETKEECEACECR
jgi:hypothetical protein